MDNNYNTISKRNQLHKHDVEKLLEYDFNKIVDGLVNRFNDIGVAAAEVKEIKKLRSMEEFIAHKNASDWALVYSQAILKWPWPEAEKIICSDEWNAYQYAMEVARRRVPIAEQSILREPVVVYHYYKDVIKEPIWPEGDAVLLETAKSAFLCAKNIRKKPWPRAEPIIKMNAAVSCCYAKYVRKKPWSDLDAEEIILDSPSREEYLHFIGLWEKGVWKKILKGANNNVAEDEIHEFITLK